VRPRALALAVLCLGGVTSTLPAQSRSAQLVATARAHIAANRLDSAEAALDLALQTAPYVMDSVNALIWRGIVHHLRGSDSLARLNFRQALILNPVTAVRGLDQISPDLPALFDAESRSVRVYSASDLDQQPAWRSGPALVYPAALRRRRVMGPATVRAVIDTLGRVEEKSIEVLETPDSGFIGPLTTMMRAQTFSPGRAGGKTVRTLASLQLNLAPPPPGNPTQLVRGAREQLAAHRPDSALALLGDALDSSTHPTEGERVYALLVQGLALRATGKDSSAAVAFDAGLEGYRALTARGVDLAPFLKRLADSIRVSRRGPRAPASPFAPPTAVGPVDVQPAVVSHPPIRYAPEMQALRIGGTVIVEATLDTTGHVVAATLKIVQSPNPVFNAEARRVVLATVYRPARARGRAIQAVIRQPITFAAY